MRPAIFVSVRNPHSRRGMGSFIDSVEQAASNAIAPIAAAPAAIWDAVSYNPGGATNQNLSYAKAAASQGDVLGTLGNIIEAGLTNVQNLVSNAFSPTVITGGSPLTRQQTDALKQQVYAQIDQAAGGNAALAAQAKAQASAQMDAAANVPAAITLPSVNVSLSDAASALGLSPGGFAAIGIGGLLLLVGAGLLVLWAVSR